MTHDEAQREIERLSGPERQYAYTLHSPAKEQPYTVGRCGTKPGRGVGWDEALEDWRMKKPPAQRQGANELRVKPVNRSSR